ncbi:MAG: hypothetical protein R2857_11560 [Vampirovibrionales bacterium]
MSNKRVKALRIPYRFDCFSPQGHGLYRLEPAALAQTVKEASTVVLGDLHGSVQKLVETLLAADLREAPARGSLQMLSHEALVNVIFNQEGNRRCPTASLVGTVLRVIVKHNSLRRIRRYWRLMFGF